MSHRHRLPIAAIASCLAAAPALAQEPADAPAAHGVMASVNDAETTNQMPRGDVRFAPLGERLEITVYARGLEPGMHRTYVWGFPDAADPREAQCPEPGADLNDDGWIDITEAGLTAGVPLLPLTADTPAMDFDSEAFPEAGTWGVADFETRVPIADLEAAVREAFGTPLALPRRVVIVHGAPFETDVPDTVASFEGASPRESVPVACAALAPGEAGVL